MTTPTQPQSQQESNRQAQAIAAIATLLAVNSSAQALTPRVARLVQPWGWAASAVSGAVTLAMSRPIPQRAGASGIATKISGEAEQTYRAAYIFAASGRLHQALRTKNLEQALEAERSYYKRHLEATAKRVIAAHRVDEAAKRHGNRMGWYAKMDNRTTKECRWANGRNFDVDTRPPMGYPGTVHVHCRCRPGPPHRGNKTVYDASPRKAA